MPASYRVQYVADSCDSLATPVHAWPPANETHRYSTYYVKYSRVHTHIMHACTVFMLMSPGT